MWLVWRRTIGTKFTDEVTGIEYDIRTTKGMIEPEFLFLKRHGLKVKLKQYLLGR